MRTVFFIPPLAKATGGLRAIYEMAGLLDALGHSVSLCAYAPEKTADFAGVSLPTLLWADALAGKALGPGDIWCVPESWPNALAPGVQAGARALVYVQNWVFMLTTLPGGVRWSQLPLSCLAVSGPVRDCMERVFGLTSLGVLPPAVDPAFFAPREEAAPPRNGKTIRIAWMPRKNRALGLQIQEITRNILHTRKTAVTPEFVEIAGKSLPEVAGILRQCHLFLSTGFPEGFALPPLEAMAAGCVPVGFSGLGGFDYMRNAPMPEYPLFTPCFPLEERPWGGNGFFVADGDILGAGTALAFAAQMAATHSEDWQIMLQQGQTAALAYSQEARKQRLARLWPDILRHFAENSTAPATRQSHRQSRNRQPI